MRTELHEFCLILQPIRNHFPRFAKLELLRALKGKFPRSYVLNIRVFYDITT